MEIGEFQRFILHWYRKHNRDDLPWRYTKKRPVSAYHILVSEIMLQQTQIARVLQKFPEFTARFPTIHDLARASVRDVLEAWQGMGYNRRGVYLKQCAERIVSDYNGQIPSDTPLLRALPGIGPYTAGAIACFGFNKPTVFLDTNMRKVFIHSFIPKKDKGRKISDKEILPIAKKVLYRRDPRKWGYALMDYGALELSGKPELTSRAKAYTRQSKFEGSIRYYRSQIVKHLLKHHVASQAQLQTLSPLDIIPLLTSLCRDGLIEKAEKRTYKIM